jgi:hypothetical protein
MWYLVMILLNLKYYIFFQATVASKFLTLTESVRDAADLYLSFDLVRKLALISNAHGN